MLKRGRWRWRGREDPEARHVSILPCGKKKKWRMLLISDLSTRTKKNKPGVSPPGSFPLPPGERWKSSRGKKKTVISGRRLRWGRTATRA